MSDLAAETSVARSTYEGHLRKAENNLIANVGQYVRLVLGAQEADPLGATGMGASGEPARSD